MQPFTIGILGEFKETYEPHYGMTKVFRDMQQHIPFQGIVEGSGPYRSKEGVISAAASSTTTGGKPTAGRFSNENRNKC